MRQQLQQAILRRNQRDIRRIVQHLATHPIDKKDWNNLLRTACLLKPDYFEKVLSALERSGYNINTPVYHDKENRKRYAPHVILTGNSPLSDHDRIENMRILLDHGMDKRFLLDDGNRNDTELKNVHISFNNHAFSMIKFILENNADVIKKDIYEHGSSSCQYPRRRMVQWALRDYPRPGEDKNSWQDILEMLLQRSYRVRSGDEPVLPPDLVRNLLQRLLIMGSTRLVLFPMLLKWILLKDAVAMLKSNQHFIDTHYPKEDREYLYGLLSELQERLHVQMLRQQTITTKAGNIMKTIQKSQHPPTQYSTHSFYKYFKNMPSQIHTQFQQY